MKTCINCGETKSVSEFNKCSGKSDGLQTYCKSCTKERLAVWRASNPEKIATCRAVNAEKERDRKSAYAAANPEKMRASSAAWRKRNPDAVRTRRAAHYAANTDKERARCAAYRVANRERFRVYDHNRRARKLANGGRLSPGLAAKLFKLQRGKCACGCKQSLGKDYHLDHRMPLALGGTNTDDNMQLLRSVCNQQKYAKHPVDFMQQRGFLL